MYDQILDNIFNGVWPPGTKLPSESELCKLLGVSRVPIRDALNRLNAMGIIQTHQGEGSRVLMLTPGMFMNSLLPMLVFNRKSMLDILEYRRIVEPENAALAAKRAEADDIANISASVEMMEKVGRPIIEFAIADMKFHLDIARATKNSLMFNVANVIRDVMVSYYRRINEITGIDKALMYHRNIFEAIRAGDSERARKWMEENLAVTIDEVSQGYPVEHEGS
ncbi:MAG: FadR/GntR family transcriptional regulator [Negativicutes bacterium]|nr:FadR/GntR family transcriptional regulator [Negativicutes bacterium]